MRLPWPFGRAQRSAPADSGASRAGASAPVELPSRPAWRELPPLAETVGPPPLVAPNRPFAAALASNEPPAPILAPLSHGRSIEAPRGIVSGVARPTTTISAPALPAPVQRSPIAGRRGEHDREADHPWAGGAASSGSDGGDVAPAGPPAGPSSAAPGPDLSPAPIRRLDAATAAPVRTNLTHAPEPARPSPLVGLVGQPLASRGGRPAPQAPALGIQRAPAAPAQPAQAFTPVLPATAAPATPETQPGGSRLTIGQARRAGLGAPVAGGPVTTSTHAFRGSHEPAPPAAPAPLAAGAPVHVTGAQRAPEPDAPELPLRSRPASPSSETAGPSLDAEGAGRGASGSLPQSMPASVGGPAARPALTASSPGRASGRSSPGGASPIVSGQPLRTGVQRAPLTLPQRASSDPAGAVPGAAAGAGAGAASAGTPVRIHRDGQAGQLAKALDARSFTHGGEIFLPASHGPLTSGAGKALLAHELTHVGQQRRLGSSLPAEHSPHGVSLEAEAVAAERSPDMTLARRPDHQPAPAAPAEAPEPDRGTAALAARGPQRAPTGEGQRTLEMGPITLLDGGESKPKPPASRHSHSEQELEILAHQLYHRIGRHLRRELLVDRERLGFALDLP